MKPASELTPAELSERRSQFALAVLCLCLGYLLGAASARETSS